MSQKSAEKTGLALDRSGVTVRRIVQVLQLQEGLVGKAMILEVAPHILHRIDFRRIRREPFVAPVLHGTNRLLGLEGFVRTQSIPHQHNRSANMAMQLTQKPDDRRRIEILIRMETKPKREASAIGRNAHGRDGRNLAMGTGSGPHKRRLTTGSPGSANERRHEESAFVDENQPGFQSRGFFLMRGHSSLIQRATSSSLRSTARRAGFWQLQPIECKRRPT